MSGKTLDRNIRLLNVAAALALLDSLVLIFWYAPVERTMGNVQRIFYFHVGSAWNAAVAFGAALLGGVLFLARRTRGPFWDTLSLASVEIGLVFVSLTIVSGSIWGRPAWNTWWLWSPRLTSVTVMWLVYAAYFMLRGAIDNRERRAVYSAVYVIAGFVTVIFSYASIRLLRDIHPVIFGGALESAQGLAEGEQAFASGLDSARMGITLAATTGAFTLIYLAWLANRIRMERLIEQTNELKARVSAYLQNASSRQV